MTLKIIPIPYEFVFLCTVDCFGVFSDIKMSQPKKRPSGAVFRKRAQMKSEENKKYPGTIKNWLSKEDDERNWLVFAKLND